MTLTGLAGAGPDTDPCVALMMLPIMPPALPVTRADLAPVKVDLIGLRNRICTPLFYNVKYDVHRGDLSVHLYSTMKSMMSKGETSQSS